jgi:Protein of unknown function (DUF1344)
VIRIAVAAISICLAAGSVAIGQDQVESAISGTVQSIDTQSRTVTLDGKMYHLSDRADIGSLQEGSKLNLTCDTKRANCMVVTAGKQDEVSPESTTEPSAGSNSNDLPSSSTKSKETGGGGSY